MRSSRRRFWGVILGVHGELRWVVDTVGAETSLCIQAHAHSAPANTGHSRPLQIHHGVDESTVTMWSAHNLADISTAQELLVGWSTDWS
jgi:hypothetical protein